jgi:hypothetical protein
MTCSLECRLERRFFSAAVAVRGHRNSNQVGVLSGESTERTRTSSTSCDTSEGIAITSVLHTDEHSHLEPVRYGKGSGFFIPAAKEETSPG